MSKFMIENAQISKAQTFQPLVSGNTPEIVNIADSLGKIAEWHDEISAIKNGTNIDSFGDVETALSGKLNTSDVDTALSSTSTNPVQNKAVQAPVARLVDAGAKNLLPPKVGGTSASVTFTVQDDGTVVANGTATGRDANYYGSTVPVAGSYHVSGCPSGGNFATGYACYWSGPNVSEIGNGAVFSFTGSVTFRIIIRQGTTVNNLVFKPMICTAENYAISPNFVPYAKSNYELTQEDASIRIDGLFPKKHFWQHRRFK